MTKFGKFAAVATLTGALAVALATPSEARNGRWAAAGVGFAAGALVGAAAANANNGYYYGGPGYYGGPAYYDYGPTYSYGYAEPVYDSYAYEPTYVAPRPYYRSYYQQNRNDFGAGGVSGN